MHTYISHRQDLNDLFEELKKEKPPFHVVVSKGKPQDEEELGRWKRLNGFFHRGIVPTYGSLAGLIETEAKHQLQSMFALVEDHQSHYVVESIAGMSINRLIQFIEQCQTHMVKEFGAQANDMIEHSKISLLKTKKINK